MSVKKEDKNKRRKQQKDSFLTTGFAFLVLFPMMYLMLPTVIFMLLSMLPTLVALIIDASSKRKLKYKWLCVGGLNFSGTLPYLFRLWFGDNSWSGAVGLFLGNGCFLIVYFTALIGWSFYRFIPPIVLNFLEVTDQRRVVNLREDQAKLIAKWGEEVAGTASLADAKKEPAAQAPAAKKP